MSHSPADRETAKDILEAKADKIYSWLLEALHEHTQEETEDIHTERGNEYEIVYSAVFERFQEEKKPKGACHVVKNKVFR